MANQQKKSGVKPTLKEETLSVNLTWNPEKIVDDSTFDAHEAEEFRNLINGKSSDTLLETANLYQGKILPGSIVEITKDHVVVDVGLKSEGLVPISEFSNPEEIVLGNAIEVLLDNLEDNYGQIVLSKEKAEKLRQWEHICEHCEEGSIVTGRVLRKVKGGLMVDIGMEAFLPGSQIDNKRIKNLDEYIGNTYEFKILKINIDRKNVVVSRRELLEAERISKRAELLDSIEPGDIRQGVVKNITDFGVFLDLDGIDGLLHITDMTWKRIKHPSEMVKLNDVLEVMILSIDKDKGRVALGLKQKESNPWEEIESRYAPGTRVKGTIVNLLPYGAFIEIEPGIEGLIHISEMSWVKNVTDPSEIVKKGDEVSAIVLAIQKEEGRISLGMKQIERNPWDDVEEKYPIGTVVDVEIKSLTNFGAFVELEPGIEGLIHISDLSWTKKVSHPSEILKKGDRVKTVVLSIDKENTKIALGMKQLERNPWEEIDKVMPVGKQVHGVISKITAFGAYVDLEQGIKGLIHITELSDKDLVKVDDLFNVGDSVTAYVLKIDPEQKTIYLSLKKDSERGKSHSNDDILLG